MTTGSGLKYVSEVLGPGPVPARPPASAQDPIAGAVLVAVSRQGARLFVYAPRRLAPKKAIPTPTMTAIAPAAAQNGDPPTIGSQFATQGVGLL